MSEKLPGRGVISAGHRKSNAFSTAAKALASSVDRAPLSLRDLKRNKVRFAEVRIPEIRTRETGPAEVGAGQARGAEVGTIEVCFRKVRSKIGFSECQRLQVSTPCWRTFDMFWIGHRFQSLRVSLLESNTLQLAFRLQIIL
jgi:hypothetical protein